MVCVRHVRRSPLRCRSIRQLLAQPRGGGGDVGGVGHQDVGQGRDLDAFGGDFVAVAEMAHPPHAGIARFPRSRCVPATSEHGRDIAVAERSSSSRAVGRRHRQAAQVDGRRLAAFRASAASRSAISCSRLSAQARCGSRRRRSVATFIVPLLQQGKAQACRPRVLPPPPRRSGARPQSVDAAGWRRAPAAPARSRPACAATIRSARATSWAVRFLPLSCRSMSAPWKVRTVPGCRAELHGVDDDQRAEFLDFGQKREADGAAVAQGDRHGRCRRLLHAPRAPGRHGCRRRRR